MDGLYYGAGRRGETAPHQSRWQALGAGIGIDEETLAEVFREIYASRGGHADAVEPHLFRALAATFTSAVAKGAAPTLGRDPFLDALMHSADVFAAFKTHRAQTDMATRLLDSNGNLKPFEQWKKEVEPIASHQCGAWLETEYNTAVLRARQAAQWQQFEREKDILPNLRWLPSTSPHPGKDHQPFWDTVLPVDHPFWNRHRPGDRWNCKCDLTSTDEPVTAVPDEAAGNDPQPGLRDNPGQSGALIGDDHPYFPKDCRHCPFYKPGVKARMRALFMGQVKDCYHCPYVDGCVDRAKEGAEGANSRHTQSEVLQHVKIHIAEVKKKLDQWQGAVVKDKRYLTGQIRVLRRSLTDIIDHDIEDETLMKWMSKFKLKDVKGWKYEGWAKNRPYEPDHPKFDPKNPNRPKHPETEYFLYYSKDIEGKKYWANVKMHKDYNGEVLYTIEPKEPNDLIIGEPPK